MHITVHCNENDCVYWTDDDECGRGIGAGGLEVNIFNGKCQDKEEK